MSDSSIEQLAGDNLVIRIRTIDRAGNVLADRAFSGAGDDGSYFSGCAPAEACGSYANAEVAATTYENEQRWDSARESRGWIVDRNYE